MTTDDEAVDDVDTVAVRAVLESHPVRLGVLFGSRVRGTSGDHSDVDVAVEFDPSLSDDERYRARLSLVVELARALGIDDIDVTVLDGTRPEVARSALASGIVLVGDPDHAAELLAEYEQQSSCPTREQRRKRFDETLARLEELT